MVSFPPCKINLGLNVIRKRSDGYHDIETCFYPVPWNDVLEVIKSESFQFTTSGILVPGSAADNLCIKAYHTLGNDFKLDPIKIHLHKIIPMGAGLGGGSSDAAHTLLLLNEVFDLKLSPSDLQQYAARIGSDCSFFIRDLPMIGSGRGEVLRPTSVNLKGKFIVIVKPDIHVSTAEAYAGIKPGTPDVSLTSVVGLPVREWKDKLVNDFEKTVFDKHPIVGEIKESLYNAGALYSSMSGSGSSVFGIFDLPIDLKPAFGSMTYWSGLLVV
ncbi:MAG TPA: 4-(cytidine 5'-diphospho)-2-C-methyl-D-erythritol kinase [Cyclobacteriaceae bacterium]|nr:4-(cytidine 5'-diphospho)-2-C-methyl-D-erythritol kinase [Cyclobacteriaceae bacterium]